ncbi:hypothetical protein NC652_015925 [Populus alba x Populus x berolinensis]|nr:hypothetical protein NC652_015925 [Populus alba x Populus x berolinensis]
MKTQLIEDKQALLDFVDNLPHSQSLNWKDGSPDHCNSWTGVICCGDGTRVIAVRLHGDWVVDIGGLRKWAPEDESFFSFFFEMEGRPDPAGSIHTGEALFS